MAEERISLFGSVPAEFPSDFTLDESTERLRALLDRSKGWMASLEFRPVGKATAQKVCLLPWGPTGPCGPEFRGQFQIRQERVVLVGGFGLPLYGRVGLIVYATLIVLAAAACFAGWLAGNDWAGLAALMFLLGGALLAVLAHLSSRYLMSDIPWLAAVIARELSSDPAIASKPLPVPFAARFCTLDCKTILWMTCLLSAASAITGIRAAHQDAERNVHYVMHETWGRVIVASVAIITAIALVGLYRRTLFAWKCGLVGIPLFGLALVIWLAAITVTTPLPQMDPQLNMTGAAWIVVAFLAALIGLVITRRTMLWYRQKDLFVRARNEAVKNREA